MQVKRLCVRCAPQRVRYQLSLQLALECALRCQLVRLGCRWSRRRPCLRSVLIRDTFKHKNLLTGVHMTFR